MSNPINDLFLSEMTLLMPSRDGDLDITGQAIVPFTWEENITSEKRTLSNVKTFLESLPSFENNFSNFRHRSSHTSDVTDAGITEDVNTGVFTRTTHALRDHQYQVANAHKSASRSNWYNYCLAIHADKQTFDSRGEFRTASVSRASSVEEEYTEDDLFTGELSVKGLHVDPKILAGFNYIVRLADSDKHLFHGKALRLVSVGRGYGKRITFESNSATTNDNYFYSDTHASGYGFRLVAVEAQQKFTMRDNFGNSVGFATVSDVVDQIEEKQEVNASKQVKKYVRVSFNCDLERFNDYGGFQSKFVEGTAVLLREKSNGAAVLTEIIKCSVDGEKVGFTFLPGVDEKERISVVSGDVGCIPASYIVTGLQPHELPVIGTFVHPNIVIGAKYKVRNLDTGKFLFDGHALTLQSIGRGYGPRITFASETSIHNDNYFYSDTNEGGFGFTVEALSVGDQFRIINSSTSEELGYAEVCRADKPQRQHPSKDVCRGVVDVEVTCNINMMEEICTVRVTGTAIMERTRSAISMSLRDVSLGGSLSHLSNQSLLFQPL